MLLSNNRSLWQLMSELQGSRHTIVTNLYFPSINRLRGLQPYPIFRPFLGPSFRQNRTHRDL